MILDLPPRPKSATALPTGMSIKRAPSILIKKINFDKAMCPSEPCNCDERDPYEGFPFGTSLNALVVDVRHLGYPPSWEPDESEPLPYPLFQTHTVDSGSEPKRILGCYVEYVLTDSSGNHFEHTADIFVKNPLSDKTQEFLSCLTRNGIFEWEQLIGCQAVVTIQVRQVFDGSNFVNCVVMEEHEFVYEPKGGGGNAKSR